MVGRSIGNRIRSGQGNSAEKVNSEGAGRSPGSPGRSTKQEFNLEDRAEEQSDQVDYMMRAAKIAEEKSISIDEAMDELDAILEQEQLERKQKLAEGALDATVVKPADDSPEDDQENKTTTE